MPIIKAKTKVEKEQLRVSIDSKLIANVREYCDWANVQKIDDFFEQAASFILAKDKEWVKYINLEKPILKESSNG